MHNTIRFLKRPEDLQGRDAADGLCRRTGTACEATAAAPAVPHP